MCQKEMHIYSFLEPFLLYWILFLPGIGSTAVPDTIIHFSISNLLNGFFLYSLPALLLVLYVLRIHDVKKKFPFDKPKKFDIVHAVLILFSLLSVVAFLSLVSFLFPRFLPAAPRIEAPSGIFSWLMVFVSSITTAYLEETYFRVYLFHQFDKAAIPGLATLVLSCTLFALCHLYEGSFGFINAFVAGLVLFLFYRRYNSLHSIAWAHAVYNMIAYFLAIN